MRILQLIVINDHTLLVFLNSSYWFQFTIILPNYKVFSPQTIFASRHLAEQEGRQAVHILSA